MKQLTYGMRFFITFSITLSLIGLPSSSIMSNNFLHQAAFAQQQQILLSQHKQQQQRPNILMIVGDDFGFSDIGAFGSQILTPNLDALAKDGKILTNYHTNPVCSPARVSLLTGVDHHIGGIGTMYEAIAPNQIGKPGYETYINDKTVTIAELLKDAGYHTYLSGKWHLSGNSAQNGTLPHDRGFEKSLTLLNGGANHFNTQTQPLEKISFAEDGKIIPRPGNSTLYSNDLYAEKMIEYIKNGASDGKPFLAYLAFQVAHSPFQAPEGTISKYFKTFSVGWDELRKQSFEKQKELGFWPADMKLPQRIPPNQPWNELTQGQKNYVIRILATHAVMIENMDHAIGNVIQALKQKGQYDNTLIVFVSDNGSSEPAPLLYIALSAILNSGKPSFLATVNNSLSNIGNASSIVNYAAWGSYSTTSPLSGYKTTMYEGGTRVPFVIKEPTSALYSSSSNSNSTTAFNSNKVIKAFAFVNDLAPTILDYAGINHLGTMYNGHPVHPIMGKSLKPLLNGTVNRVHGQNEIVADEMFNNSAVYMGDWKATKHPPPVGDGKWQLFNLTSDPGQNYDVASQHQDILQKMIDGYDTYAKNVGVIPPLGQKFHNMMAVTIPPLDQSQVTITLKDILPGKFNTIKSINASKIQSSIASKFPTLHEIQTFLES
jgi:arylsulfatase A-like enzyme